MKIAIDGRKHNAYIQKYNEFLNSGRQPVF